MKSIDRVIVEVYATYPHTPDDIVTTPEVAEHFSSEVNSRLPVEERTNTASINKRLLNLRRRGSQNGGLPRRWRD
jgi:hypothetical protein